MREIRIGRYMHLQRRKADESKNGNIIISQKSWVLSVYQSRDYTGEEKLKNHNRVIMHNRIIAVS